VGLDNLAEDGVVITFEDGHRRQLPRLTGGPFRYATHADAYLERALSLANAPVKQAAIAPSALSLIYPEPGIDGYPRGQFIEDLVREAEADIRGCLRRGAHAVQLDFTEGRLAVKLKAGNFYIQLASESDPRGVLEVIREHAKPQQRIFVGVIDPIQPRIETPEEVCERVLQAAEYIPIDRLGSTDDCGFAPFGDDTSTSRETAFAKIRARVEGTRMASKRLGV
jgi:5-methyltetrahydropteroyltriglutamate--homocysteine methyltransferase